VQGIMAQLASDTREDPIQALSVSSLGEAMVPVTADRRILGPSIVANLDLRGAEYQAQLADLIDDVSLYRINGNTLGPNYSATKLMWIKAHRPDLYRRTDKFLLWGSFVPFMLGAEPAVDYSLANRTLLFDLEQEDWSERLLDAAGIKRGKLPRPVASGSVIGEVAPDVARALGLPPGVTIVSGAHDQCANAVGCGVIQEGQAVYGLGTFACITPVFRERRDPGLMIERGLNTEHHAVPGRFVSFIYNQAGSVVKWFRDTFAVTDRRLAEAKEEEIYPALLAEMPDEPSDVMVLPHFCTTGPPDFIADSAGVMTGLRLETTRGEVLKGIIEGTTYYLRECVESLPPTGIHVDDFRVVGGGSKSDAWVQICADIMARPCIRPRVTEAGTLACFRHFYAK
jgi:xylulokinase